VKIFAYYNEFNPKAAAWLRQLIKNGNITPGEVDERSITEVKPSDIKGFNRVHFFAGIGTWDYCLNQSGWGDKPVWTASLPCQPFSCAGKGLGKSDERHLLPHFIELVRQCKPDTIIGEQVEAAIRHGWLDDLQANMEAEGYAIGHCVLGAHSVGAPHIRQRLYWLADSAMCRRQLESRQESAGIFNGQAANSLSRERVSNDSASTGWMADTEIATWQRPEQGGNSESYGGKFVSRMGNTEHEQHEGRLSGCGEESSKNEKWPASEFTGPGEIDWIYCRDNKYRPVKSCIQPLVDGIARGMVYSSDTGEPINANETQEARVMRLQGYGNAIQAQTATEFIKAYMSI